MGGPTQVVSDNGPCYVSEIFKELMKGYQVNHITSSPHYPQSNGLTEKYVQIIKNLFYKAKEEGQDLHKCLMIYRNTPLSSSSLITYVDLIKQSNQIHIASIQNGKKADGDTK